MVAQTKEIEEVTSSKVSCQGSTINISEGHPKIWLQISLEEGVINCPYCEKIFVLKPKE